jgi:hypothetical protein
MNIDPTPLLYWGLMALFFVALMRARKAARRK